MSTHVLPPQFNWLPPFQLNANQSRSKAHSVHMMHVNLANVTFAVAPLNGKELQIFKILASAPQIEKIQGAFFFFLRETDGDVRTYPRLKFWVTPSNWRNNWGNVDSAGPATLLTYGGPQLCYGIEAIRIRDSPIASHRRSSLKDISLGQWRLSLKYLHYYTSRACRIAEVYARVWCYPKKAGGKIDNFFWKYRHRE